jgi:glycosyltransferase involved in cell wall biosynthesis
MGTAITRGGVLGFGVKQLMRATQRSAHHVFVQNPDDEGYVLQTGIVRRERVSRLPGSGIDLDEYRVEPMPGDKQPVHFALIARLVPEKGVIEFMEAARILHRSGVSARFSIAGAIPSGFSGDIDRDALSSWGREPGQQWLGKLNSARDLIASADCVVLPSYREGTPRVLLEAAAMGRPIIAADSIGTREPLTPGVTGLLCMPRDPNDLARAMQEMVQRGSVRRLEMGLAGRRLMERKYDVNFVVDAYMQKIDEILK